jgi:hypothetical protein
MGRTSIATPGLVSWSSSSAMASAPSRLSASIRNRPARYSLLSMNGPSVSSIRPSSLRSVVVMTVDPLHDETWTQQHRAHRGNELDNLEAAIRRRTM